MAMGAEVERQIRLAVEALVEGDAVKAAAGHRRATPAIDDQEVKNEEDGDPPPRHPAAGRRRPAAPRRGAQDQLRPRADRRPRGEHRRGRRADVGEAALQALDRHPEHGRGGARDAEGLARRLREPRRGARPEVCQRDDILDEKNSSLIRELLTYMAENPALITYCIEIMSISKNLERVGDLATNIGEETIYIAEGRIIKHAFGPKHQEETP